MDKSSLPPSLLVACDDTATLEAALDLIDHCDDPLTDPVDPDQTQDFDMSLDNLSEFLDHVDIPAPTSETNANNESIRPHTTVVRRRTTRKQEIAQLRAEERDLACALENLRLQTYSQKHRSRSTKNGKILPFWKKIASRQYQSRLDSERENRRLRSLVTMHIGRAKHLKLAWKKQMVAEGYHKDTEANSQNSDELFAPDTPTVLQQLTRDADAVYASLDAFLSGVQQQKRNQVPFLDHADVYALPFDSQVVDRAIWHALASRFRGHQQQSNVTDDTIRSCALRSHRMMNMNLCLRIRWVARKYKEAGRTVIITRTFIEPLHLATPANVGFRETQVSIVTPMKCPNDTKDDTSTPSTLVDTHASVTGDGPDGGTGDGMCAWIASSGGVAARDIWMHAFQVRKNAIEDQLFEVSRIMSDLSHDAVIEAEL